MKKFELSYMVDGHLKWYIRFGNNLAITVWSRNSLVIYPRELKTGVQTKIWTWMLIAALYILAKKWKQFKCPTMDEWIRKVCFIHTMKYYSVIKGKEVLIHVTTWMDFENIVKDARHSKHKYCLIPFIWNVQKRQTQEKTLISSCQGLEQRKNGECLLNGMEFLLGVTKIFWN